MQVDNIAAPLPELFWRIPFVPSPFSVHIQARDESAPMMIRQKHADFTGGDSINNVQLKQGISASDTHTRCHAGTSSWRQNTILALFIVIVVLTVIILHCKIIQVQSSNGLPCLNKSCVRMASNILDAMDLSVDPCDDFYSYSCNGWAKANPIPDGRRSWTTYRKLNQQNQFVIKHVLDQPFENLKSKAEKKAKMYYESCLDVNNTIEKLGAIPMLVLLRNLGGWNITDSGFDPKNWSFQNILQLVQNKYNIGALFSCVVGVDDRNSSRYTLKIDQSGLSLPKRKYYLNRGKHSKVLEACLDYMTRVGVLLGGEVHSTKEQMQAVIEFEIKLANITTPNKMRRNKESLYNMMTVADLRARAKFLDWRAFLQDAMKIVNRKITSKEKILVYAPEYLGNLSSLIKEYQSTTEGNITLNNYLVWQTVQAFSSWLSHAFRNASIGLDNALMDSEAEEETPWRYCVQETNNVLGYAIGAIFVREVFHLDWKNQAEEMINNLRNAFKANLVKLKWMDNYTRQVAIIKADAVSHVIGYPEFIRDVKQLDQHYEQLEVRSDTYFDNILNISFQNFKKNLEIINDPVNKTTWSISHISPCTVNAFYSPTEHKILCPAGILQSPFYHPTFPPSLNYGGIGMAMSHELIHGFDDQAREIKRFSNLNHWWKFETIALLKNRTKCLVNQYNKFQIDGKSINGIQTLEENIADNGALKTAYHAYLSLMQDKPEPPTLPGLALNHKQLFFVAFAQVWCSSETKETLAFEIERESHSPRKFRVNGALSNLKEFGDVFKCAVGTQMNPKNKCEVW